MENSKIDKNYEVTYKREADIDHQDISTSIHIYSAKELEIIRKLDWHLMPLLFVLYSFSVLDRSNLGNAKLAGLQNAIDLGGNRYQWLANSFYIAYILFQLTILGWKQFKPHQWCATAVFLWGFVATIQATVTSWSGLMACRWFLGVAEAMFGPGVILYLSFFYSREKVGFRHGLFVSGAALANAYGGALAYAISHIHSSKAAPWQILFIIEGVPTCLLTVIVWFYLPDSVTTCKFLSEEEREIATTMVARNQHVDAPNKGANVTQVLKAFTDYRSYIPPLMYFFCNVAFGSLPLFLPTIISEMGSFTTIQSNGLSAPPFLFVFFMIILVAWLSDKTGMRGPFDAAAAFVAAVGFILLATGTSTGARYTGTFLATCIFVCVSITLSWVSNTHANESKRGGAYVILGTIGQCGPLLGTNVFPPSDAPYYRKGMWVSCASCLMVGFLSITFSLLLWRENRKMDKGKDVSEGTNIPGVSVIRRNIRYII